MFALRERNVEHELPLRRILKPKRRKFERLESAGVDEVDDSPSIDGISSEAIWMPGKDTLCFSAFDPRDYVVKNRPTWNFGRSRLDKFLDNCEPLSFGGEAKLEELSLDRKHLLFFAVCRFASVMWSST